MIDDDPTGRGQGVSTIHQSQLGSAEGKGGKVQAGNAELPEITTAYPRISVAWSPSFALKGNMSPQPRMQVHKVERSGGIEAEHEFFRLRSARRQAGTVDDQECVDSGECRALVAVDEGVVLRQALPQGSGFRNQIAILGSVGRKGQKTTITSSLLKMSCRRPITS